MKDLLEKFIKFEKENLLFERQYKNVFYWHLVRTWIYYSILTNTNDYDELSNKQGSISGIIRKMGVIIFNIIINIKQFPIRKHQCDVLFSTMYDYRKVNNEYKNIFIDFLEINSSLITKKFEYNDQLHISNKADINSCYADIKMIVSYTLYRFGLRKIKNPENELAFIENLIDKINDEFNVNLSKRVLQQRMIYSVIIWESYYKTIKSYLKKVNPRIVIMVCAYGLRHFATIKAAKDLGIITVELQHGVIVPWHIDYNFADLKNSSKYFPDNLFTFGEYWKNVCRTPSECNKRAVGYAYIDYFEKKQMRTSGRNSNGIVFYSTREEEFAEFVSRFADITIGTQYEIIFKYHPMECGKIRYSCLSDKNIQIIDRAEEVHTYISLYEHHVSVGSTVLFESAMRGASIYVLDRTGKEYMETLLDSGYGQLVRDEYELLNGIRNFYELKNQDISKLLLTRNANENINNELISIMGDI